MATRKTFFGKPYKPRVVGGRENVCVLFACGYGDAEIARPDIAKPSKLWGLTSRDWTSRDLTTRIRSNGGGHFFAEHSLLSREKNAHYPS